MLVTLYKLPSFESVDDFLQKVATVRGKLKKGGIVDVEAAARIVLHDWNEGNVLNASVATYFPSQYSNTSDKNANYNV